MDRKTNTCVPYYCDNIDPIIGESYLKYQSSNCKNTYKFLVTNLDSCPILDLKLEKN